MTLVIPLAQIGGSQGHLVGGKAVNLSRLTKAGHAVPRGLCITTEAYLEFTRETGLANRIDLEYNRLNLDEMRWEEIWDLALRIRNMFLTAPFPKSLYENIVQSISTLDCSGPVAVRSSSPQEDSSESSFAGLHESFLNIQGHDDILKHVKLVWASLWSDGAVLYRNELEMSPRDSAMAVIVQELVEGEVSGVVFSRSPNSQSHIMIEAVYGLNEGLVDGTVMPDRWTIDHASRSIISHDSADRTHCITKAESGTQSIPLTAKKIASSPLTDDEVLRVAELGACLEDEFGAPQDVEWTVCDGQLMVLQTRPITTITRHQDATDKPWSKNDKRPWYLSLKRSFDNLKTLRDKVENTILPGMEKDALAMDAIGLSGLSKEELAQEIKYRKERHAHWNDVYWQDCIPLAHGVRLFGQLYNDALSPEDPYEFIHLLGGTGMAAVERNQSLIALASKLQESPSLRMAIEADETTDETDLFYSELRTFVDDYGDQTFKAVRFFQDQDSLVNMLMEMALNLKNQVWNEPLKTAHGEDEFINAFPVAKQDMARELLDLGRASYRLRDDDNIYIAKVDAQVRKAIGEARKRLILEGVKLKPTVSVDEVVAHLSQAVKPAVDVPQELLIDEPIEAQTKSIIPRNLNTCELGFVLRARQLLGQPAGPGIATGPARVITNSDDLFKLKSGEILICDSIEPTMTFVVSLVGGIVERRGGMLIHGAIIAREYGIPCVTGVADVTALVSTGELITVDGYLGIVTLAENK